MTYPIDVRILDDSNGGGYPYSRKPSVLDAQLLPGARAPSRLRVWKLSEYPSVALHMALFRVAWQAPAI